MSMYAKGSQLLQVLSDVLYCVNYSKNFYLYCITHKDIRLITTNKFLRIRHKVTAWAKFNQATKKSDSA